MTVEKQVQNLIDQLNITKTMLSKDTDVMIMNTLGAILERLSAIEMSLQYKSCHCNYPINKYGAFGSTLTKEVMK